MKVMDKRAIEIAASNAKRLADETTPLIRNCWYVAAFSGDIPEGKIFSRRLLNTNVVLFRNAHGITALHDRCAHRSFPLSEGYMDDDRLVCGYHGFEYDHAGRCVRVPSQEGRCPKNIGVRSYPVVERAPHVWIWLGDPDKADPALVPGYAWMADSPEWAGGHGYMHVASSYVFLHENLLDLSHLSYLHAKTFGTPDYATAPFEAETSEGRYVVRRTVSPTRLPPIYAKTTGMTDVDAARIVESTFISPGLSFTELTLRNLTLPESQRRDYHLKTAQIITPETQDTLHYHFTVVRDFDLDNEETTAFIMASIKAAFDEDVFALERIAETRRQDQNPYFFEQSVLADRAGVAMRRHLNELARQEAEEQEAAA